MQEYLQSIGKGWTIEEIQQLYCHCLKKIFVTIRYFKSIDVSHPLVNLNYINDFQTALIILCFLSLGGQRKQVIVNMNIQRFIFREQFGLFFILPGSEKVPRQTAEGIPCPLFLGVLIDYYMSTLRPHLLKGTEGILSIWLNFAGKPLDGDRFNRRIAGFIKEMFPKKLSTPIDFRRAIPSFCWKKQLSFGGKTITDFLHDLALLMNTSYPVLMKHYIRSSATEQSLNVMKLIYSNIFETVESNELHAQVEAFFVEDEASTNVNTSIDVNSEEDPQIVAILSHEKEEGTEEISYYVKYKDDKQLWCSASTVTKDGAKALEQYREAQLNKVESLVQLNKGYIFKLMLTWR